VTKRVVGIFVVLLSARLLVPLSNILPAVLISLLAAVVVLAIDLGLTEGSEKPPQVKF
jgi:hypothetical protein